MSPARSLLIALAAAGLAACTQTASPPAAPPAAMAGPGVTPAGFAMPAASGCAGDIARFRAILANDLQTGHLSSSVASRAEADIGRAVPVCSAGRDGEARAIVASTRARYGYP